MSTTQRSVSTQTNTWFLVGSCKVLCPWPSWPWKPHWEMVGNNHLQGKKINKTSYVNVMNIAKVHELSLNLLNCFQKRAKWRTVSDWLGGKETLKVEDRYPLEYQVLVSSSELWLFYQGKSKPCVWLSASLEHMADMAHGTSISHLDEKTYLEVLVFSSHPHVMTLTQINVQVRTTSHECIVKKVPQRIRLQYVCIVWYVWFGHCAITINLKAFVGAPQRFHQFINSPNPKHASGRKNFLESQVVIMSILILIHMEMFQNSSYKTLEITSNSWNFVKS